MAAAIPPAPRRHPSQLRSSGKALLHTPVTLAGTLGALAAVAQYAGAPAAGLLFAMGAGWVSAVAAIGAAVLGGVYNTFWAPSAKYRRTHRDIDLMLAGVARLLTGYYRSDPKEAAALVEIQGGILGTVVAVTRKMTRAPDSETFVSANLMVPSDDMSKLRLVQFDKVYAGRQKIELPLSEGVPGASAAFLTGKYQYVQDIKDPKYEQYFKRDEPYRCVLSVPVKDDHEKPVAVVNVDAVEPDFFERAVSGGAAELVRTLLPVVEMTGITLHK